MNVNQSSLARKNLEKRFAPLREADLMPPPRGWIRAIREALGMSTKQLASRLKVVPSRVTALEQAEVTDSTTLKSLRQAAEAMDCTLIYAIVPTHPLEEMLRARARILANEELARTNHTMRLENQALDPDDLTAAQERIIDELITGSLRRLWEQP